MPAPYTVSLIPGDGTGPEITETVVHVLEATGVKFNWDICEVGEVANIPIKFYAGGF